MGFNTQKSNPTFTTYINSITHIHFRTQNKEEMKLPAQKAISFAMLFILIISLSSVFVGVPNEVESQQPEMQPEIMDNTQIDEGNFGEFRGSRADGLNIDLVSKPLFGFAMDVFVEGNLAYLCAGYSLLIFDVTDTLNPTLLGYYDFPTFATGVFVEEGLAYVTNYFDGLKILDVTTPSSPEFVRKVGITAGDAQGVYILGSHAYVAHTSGLAIVDRSSYSVNNYDTGGSISRLFVTQTGAFKYAYLPVSGEGFLIVNVTNPNTPKEEGRNDTYSISMYPRDVFVSEPFAYLTDESLGLIAFNISDKTDPWAPSAYPMAFSDNYAGVMLSGDYAFITVEDVDEQAGLAIVDVSDPENPVFHMTYPTEGDAGTVFIENEYAFLTAQEFGLIIIRVSGVPPSPSTRGDFRTGYWPRDANRIGNYLYIADSGAGLEILDVSDPENPYIAAYYDTQGECVAVNVEGSKAYVADGNGGLVVIKGIPNNPQEDWILQTDGFVYDVDVQNQYAYVATGDYGLRIININTHAEVAEFDIEEQATYSVQVVDNFVYLGDGNGLRIVNITNALTPKEEAFYRILDPGIYSSTDVYVTGSYAYVTDMINGLTILDISDPSNPEFLGSASQSLSTGVMALGNTAYLTHMQGLRALGTSTPASPKEKGYFNPSGFCSKTTVSESYAYLCALTGGLYILDIGQVADITPPTVKSHTPAISASSVDPKTVIEIEFSENMNHDSVKNAFSISTSVTGQYSWDLNKMIFKPASPLTMDTTFTVTVNTQAKDTAGNAITSSYSWQFTTKAAPPIIEYIFPQASASHVMVSSKVIIHFSRSMELTATQNAFSFTDGVITYTASSGSVIWSDLNKNMTFEPAGGFTNDMSYTFTIKHTALDSNGVGLDGDGDGIGGEDPQDDYSWSFSTIPVPPKVNSVTPRNLATMVEVDKPIEIKFSKPMNKFSVLWAIKYHDGSFNWTYASFLDNYTWETDSKLIYTPLFGWAHDTEYTVMIEASAMDTQGVTLDGNRDGIPQGEGIDDYTWSFTTIKKPPKVVSVEPDEDEDDVMPDANIVITFDRAMDKDTTEKAFSFTFNGAGTDFGIRDGEATWTNGNTKLTFNPDIDFEEAKTYTVTIGDTAEDAEGVLFEGFKWEFYIRVNSPPILWSGGVSPLSGDTETPFKFTVIYSDADGDEPRTVRVVIDGQSLKMQESDPATKNFTEGKVYELETKLDSGEHIYYFEVQNEKHKVRLPTGDATEKLKVDEPEKELVFGIFEEEIAGMPTMTCLPLGIIILVVIIISVIFVVRRGRGARTPEPRAQMMTFDTFEPAAEEAAITFMPSEEEELMSFTSFEEEKPVVIQCPECNSFLKVVADTRPFMFPCKCGAKLVLR